MIYHERRQLPVGQGFFHSGLLQSFDGDAEGRFVGTCFRYVYDCGSMTAYDSARNREIERWLSTLDQDEPIDILFVSHAHADHINGLAALLENHRALTIMMPLLAHEDRIAALARTLTDDPAAATPFYREFIADPAAALSTFRPDRIIFVTSGEGGAPGSGEGAPLEPLPDPGRRREGRAMGWKPVGRDGPRPMDSDPQSSGMADGGTVAVEQMSDSCAMMLLTPGSWEARWLLAPYVDPGVLADRTAFLDELADRLKIGTAKLMTQLAMPSFRQQLVTDHSAELKAAYDALGYNLNLTSLCLYSGPAADYPDVPRSHGFRNGVTSWRGPAEQQIGWLATGDAALKEKGRREDLLRHFGEHLRRVVTMALPHHGSGDNFHADLLAGIDPMFCVAAADQIMKWRHPGSRVVQLVASAGKLLFVTTSAEPSVFEERVTLGSDPEISE